MKNIVFYNPLGYPTLDRFKKICIMLDELGVNFIEIGIPSTDPSLDGKVIARIHNDLENKYDSETLLSVLGWIRSHTKLKVVLMTYYDGFKNFNLESIDKKLYNAVLCVDNNLDKFPEIPKIQVYDDSDSDEQIEEKLKKNVSFCYVKTSNKTGTEIKDISYVSTIKSLRQKTDLPLYLGFGIKDNDDIKTALKNGADGVIIGTEFIKNINKDKKELSEVDKYLKTLKL